MSKRHEVPFLLGLFFGRLTLNEADQLRHGLVITLPLTKKWAAERLQKIIGGSLFTRNNEMTQSVYLVVKSKADLANLRRLMINYSTTMPELYPFIRLLGKPPVLIKGIRPRRKGRADIRKHLPAL